VIGPIVAVAHRAPVDGLDPGDLDAGAAEERLVGDVELGPVDLTLLDADPASRAIWSIERRVIPPGCRPVTGAVTSVSLRTMKRLQPLPSATFPAVFSMIASSAPFSSASSFASAELT
jgi:hypothetical protein